MAQEKRTVHFVHRRLVSLLLLLTSVFQMRLSAASPKQLASSSALRQERLLLEVPPPQVWEQSLQEFQGDQMGQNCKIRLLIVDIFGWAPTNYRIFQL